MANPNWPATSPIVYLAPLDFMSTLGTTVGVMSSSSASGDLTDDQWRRAAVAGVSRNGVLREEVSFQSRGERCDGWLYRPRTDGTWPCIVMAHGMGGIRSAALPDFAERFAAAGFTVLTFDYRNIGTSEGAPRGLIDIGRQQDDLRAAVRFARDREEVRPGHIVLWGTSFGAGHVLAIAPNEPHIAAVVIQNPFVDGRASAVEAFRSAGPLRTGALVWLGLRDEFRRQCQRRPVRVALAGPPRTVAMMTTPDAVAGFNAILPIDAQGWEPNIPARLVLRMRHYRPASKIRSLGCPLLVAVCELDLLAPPGPAVELAHRAPHGQLRRYPIGHFDLFAPPWFERVADDQIAFLARVLGD